MINIPIVLVSGARPNFMKVSALWHVLKKSRHPFSPIIVHTGQHYDYQLSQVFYDDLGLPEPDFCLNVGSGNHGEQTGRVMIEFENVCLERLPRLVVVVGDVNSTLACALVAVKLGIPVAHVEAGLRSYDRNMPEEINRIVTDSIASFLFTPSRDANENLEKEGISKHKIFFVGNVMVDTLLRYRKKAEELTVWSEFNLDPWEYGVLTLHRPSNVDEPEKLLSILKGLGTIQRQTPVIFPVHPRTMARVREFGLEPLLKSMECLHTVEPMGYLQFLSLMTHARFVLTDSGGIQEETAILGIPCLTLRENTERPVTLRMGTNHLVKPDCENIVRAVVELDSTQRRFQGDPPELWDGHASERVMSVLAKAFS